MEQHTAKTVSTSSEQRPFMGLRSYEESNKEQFGGRSNEIRELYTLVETNRLTIVFGKSGIGKTSLIKAGLIPKLQNNYFFPIYIRIDYFSGKTPLHQTRELIYQKLRSRDPAIKPIGESTLWEYFRNLSLLDDLLTPLLIFDQFEEIFTIGKNKVKEVQEFITELSDLAENRVPVAVQEEWRKNSEIVSSFGGKPNFHMVISLREDYLANLESLKVYLPSMKNSRFRVLHLSARQAMDAVMKPAGNLIDQQVAAQIIKKLPGITDMDLDDQVSGEENLKRFVIEPFLLSLICYEINEKRIESGLDKITQELVEQFDITDVIESYYTKTMQGFGDNVQNGLEDSLITEGGFRKLQEIGELEIEHNITTNDIQQLIEKRILRKEKRDDVEYVELIHDVLIPVIKVKRDKRIAELKEKEKSDMIRRALELDRGRNRRRRKVVIALLSLFTILTIFLTYTIYSNVEKNRKLEKLIFARSLILDARIISNAYAADSLAALISRVAYYINKENNGENEVDFYYSMYLAVRGVKFGQEYFQVARIDDTIAIRSIVNGPGNTIFLAGTNGKIYRKKDVGDEFEIFHDLGQGNRITSLAISPDKRWLAVAGFFSNAWLFDLANAANRPLAFSMDDNLRISTPKTVCINNTGKLFVQLSNRIIAWDINKRSRILWQQKNLVEFDQNKKTNHRTNIEPKNLDYFEYSNDIIFNCMAVFENNIAIGTDSSVILLNRDSIVVITSENVGNSSSMEYDPKGTLLYIGNKLGAVSRLSLKDYSSETNQFHTDRISDIAFSGEGNYMSTASFDESVAIWNLGKDWTSTVPLVLTTPEDYRVVNIWCVSFTENNKYVLAGYWNGTVYKWPVNGDVLSDIICNEVNPSLDTTDLPNKLKIKFRTHEFEDHKCKGSNR